MAHRRREFDMQDGDIPVPELWNNNWQPLADETNGMLDRDNIPPNSVGTGVTVGNSALNSAFAHLHFALLGSTPFPVSTDFKGLQRIPLGVESFTGVVEEMVHIEGSAQVDTTWSPAPATSDRSYVRFVVMVDGMIAGETGEISLLYDKVCVPLDGAIPITAGSHDINIYVQYGAEGGAGVTHPTISIPDVTIFFKRRKR
jgi:hypothetical protein